MPDGGLQFWWIGFLHWNLATLFSDRGDVYVSGNQFWFPVRGDTEERIAPDASVVFGRPKGHRSCYKQWEENDVPMTVVFWIVGSDNDWPEMIDKCLFARRHKVEEIYIYDLAKNSLLGYLGGRQTLKRIDFTVDFVSPRLGIRFDLTGSRLAIHFPDGRPFLTPEEFGKQTRRDERLVELRVKLQSGQASDEAKEEFDRLIASPTS